MLGGLMGGIRMSARQKSARCLVTVALGFALLWLGAGSARAVSPPTPWDGVNPFDCTIQDAGQGTTVPDPGADPFCVRFDKTNQNITQLGLVDFLSKEPARVAAAVPKCFYYQEDHWRGSLIQSDQQTVVYEFYGHYFFNKATGDGGVWVTGLTVAGQTFDPRTLPGFPPQWDPYFGPGTGGVISHDDVPVDPSCVATANNPPSPVYASPAVTGLAPTASALHCTDASGRVNRTGLGPVKLGASASRVLAKLGAPESMTRGLLRYCLTGGGSLLVGERGRHARAMFLSTTSPAFTLRGKGGSAVRVGETASSFRAAFPRAKSVLTLGRTAVVEVPSRPASTRAVFAAIVAGHVASLGVYETGAIRTTRALARYLSAAG
jgi:hypothetical protein